MTDPKHFDLGARYTVAGVAVSISNGRLNFGLTSGLTPRQVRNLRLHVCGKTYAFAEATIDSTGRSYCWPAAGLDWSGLVGMPRVLHLTVRKNAAATGAPSVSGTAQVGATVFASTAGIRDAGGLTNPDWENRWIRVDADGSSNPEEISGETGDSYTLTADDAGSRCAAATIFPASATATNLFQLAAPFEHGAALRTARPPDRIRNVNEPGRPP